MKKVVLAVGLIVLFAGAMIYGCTKESLEPETQTGSSIDVTSSTISSDYSWVGELHNKCLEEIGKHVDFPNLTVPQKDSIIDATLENSTHVDSLDPNTLTHARNNYSVQTPFSDIVDGLNENGSIDNLVASRLLAIDSAITSSNTLNEALDKFNSLETDIENSDALSYEEKNGIIGGIIIARYSSIFWNATVTDSENEWYSVVISETGGSDEYEALFGRIRADVKYYLKAFFDTDGGLRRRHSEGTRVGGAYSDLASAG